MRLLTVLLVACVLAFSHLAATAYAAVPLQMQNALKAQFPKAELVSGCVGMLSSNTLKDAVVIIRDEDGAYRIVLFQSLPNGDYRFHSQSQDLGTLRAIYNFSVDIRNRSLFVVTSWPRGLQYRSDDFQFKYIGDSLHLAGLERDAGSMEEGHEDESYKVSANFLTGRKTESFSFVANGKEVTKTARSRFRQAPVLLQDFDMSLGLEPALARSIDLHR